MPSTHTIHGQIVKMEANVLSGDTLVFSIDAADDQDSPDTYKVAHVVWFPKMEHVPEVISRLRFMADQLAAIYYQHTASINRVRLPKPNLVVLEQEWDEHEAAGMSCSVPHVGGQCPDCPSPDDENDHKQKVADATRALQANRPPAISRVDQYDD